MFLRRAFSSMFQSVIRKNSANSYHTWHAACPRYFPRSSKLPWAPTTAHIPPGQIATEIFFSGYRPLGDNLATRTSNFGATKDIILTIDGDTKDSIQLPTTSLATQELFAESEGSVTANKSHTMEATSVKRKRRLKMNKHKYRKRMKKQRALRRRLGK
ncbi:hypothetical protein SJAG_00077 [Schizosaccharomyces japonicus yFS275]|uniref:Small ribosomal subunit protein mS38 n=1 Tax=Schizosaccharomyces japonicus (strain yFS275 / FY16936) TaxID=402676 RepID=B6JUX8_SCHJY|nr:hypothetical protein SJAG_00077 [Schizosaccharomyces japonicus yFS275]EEB05082.1 hypothetical protein SJAG_00077 [Schizosaccharomyces japonicus yFS275]